ncbi:MAG: hypothetical protein VYE68_07860 [Acidobacteriota bacterium]|nr:hypothetical protein [Acidobacteriota bacterium]
MPGYGLRLAALAVGVSMVPGSATSVSAQIPTTLQGFGVPVYPAFEGWYQNEDGTATVLVGFYNSNTDQTVDLPVGELNYFTPGPQDRGQPTYFPPGRAWGVFTLEVPRDFDGELSWTLVANEQPITIPFHLEAPYFVEPFKDASNNNEPPRLRFAPQSEPLVGPPLGIAHVLTGSVGAPIDLNVWLSDVTPDTHVRENPFRRSPPMSLRWHKLRGPGVVEFGESEFEYDETTEQAVTTTATFDVAGEYWLRAEALDSTGVGGSGFQCCWTSAIVRVTVSE